MITVFRLNQPPVIYESGEAWLAEAMTEVIRRMAEAASAPPAEVRSCGA